MRLFARPNPQRLLLLLGALAAILAGSAQAASAAVTIHSFSGAPSTTNAGGHPDFLVEFSISSRQAEPTRCACNDAKDIDIHLPTGLIGDPDAIPRCEIAEFASDQCPVASQVGVIDAGVSAAPGQVPNGHFIAPIFNLVPPPTQPGLLGFKSGLFDTPTFEDVGDRTDSDYGVDLDISSINHILPIGSSTQVTWGVPAESIHNGLRFAHGQASLSRFETAPRLCDAQGRASTTDPGTVFQLCHIGGVSSRPGAVGEAEAVLPPIKEGGPGFPVASSSPPQPFFQNPTTCGVSNLQTSLDVLSYDGGQTHADSSWPATTDCDQLSFNPSQSIEPTTSVADSASGAEFRLTVPQFESPSVPSPSELRSAVVTLPAGFSLAPNVANGKTTCSDAEAKLGTIEEAECPEDSKVGTVTVDTPVLPGPLSGAVYLGEPKPGNRFRVILALNGFGVHIKLTGSVTPDHATGQIVVTLEELPQTPLETVNVHIFGSERGAFSTPSQCGTYEVTSVFTPWDAALQAQASHQFFKITEGPNGTPCPNGPRPFDPAFEAGSTASTAAAHTDFSLEINRQDGEQNLSGLSVTTPPGFAATLKGVSYCPEASIAAASLESHTGLAEQATPSCPASSYVGELSAGAGAGSHPLFLPGRVYLAGPYKGAPLSLVFITPAVSGGYDLGNVVLRAAIHVNPETAQVTATSDPLPQIFGGIPLRLRQIYIDLNRPNFALNPTNCDPLAVEAQVTGSEGATSASSSHFQVSNCAALPFKPKLSIGFSGSTTRTGDPALKATLTYPKAGPYANIARTAVTLPATEQIDNAHIGSPCTKVQFNQGTVPGEKCPASSVIGHAVAETPLLEAPLEGPVYLRSSSHELPDVVAALNGQIDITLDGEVTTVKKSHRLRTTFATVPDAPVSKFVLSLDGAGKGLLENNTSLCAKPLHVSADITGQNGASANQSPLLQTPCGGQGKHKRAHLHRARIAGRGAR